MIANTISTRYARALILVAQDQKQVDQYGEQLRSFVELTSLNKHLLATLGNSFMDVAVRKRILEELTQKLQLNKDLNNFLKLLIQKGRVELLPLIFDEYIKLANAQMNRAVMKIVSAVELPANQYDQIVDLFSKKTGKTMLLRKQLDPKVLGGLRVHIGDQVFDYTLRTQLELMKTKMME